MEDYNRIASKYARVLTGLKEILHCLESEEEQQEEKQDESESSDTESTSQSSEEEPHEPEEEGNLETRSDHFSIWIPSRGQYRVRVFTRVDDESQPITDSTLLSHLGGEEQNGVTQASSSETVTRNFDHHEDGITKAGESAGHEAASNEEDNYAKVFEDMIAMPTDCS